MYRFIPALGITVALAACNPATTETATRARVDLGPVPLTGETVTGTGCSIVIPRAPSLPRLVDVPDNYVGNNPNAVTDRMKAWAGRIMALASNAHVSSSARATLKSELLGAARQNAMGWPEGWNRGVHKPPSVIYHTMETLFPAIVAYDQQKALFSADERAVFESWVRGIVERLGRADLVRRWDLDNKKYQYGAILAAFGYTTGDGGLMAQSARIYRTAIRGMRADGSLPGDSERGGSALNYTNTALANLIAIAEYNAAAGVDLYGETQRGRTIHDAVGFLARAARNPALIAGYADTPGWEQGSMRPYTPTNQDLRWSRGTKALWGYYYLDRFDGTPSAQTLRAAMPFLAAGRAGTDQQSGGNARCYVG